MRAPEPVGTDSWRSRQRLHHRSRGTPHVATTLIVLWLSLIALVSWLTVLLLPWQPHRTRERLDADSDADPDLRDVAVLVPARNEAAVIERTLAALAVQGRDLEVFVIDDQSEDGTAVVAAQFAAAHGEAMTLRSIAGGALPEGWAGKLWALEQGLARVERPYTLLLDADIELAPRMLPTLLRAARASDASLVSIMAELSCATFWERLLAPPFVWFFKLLYPFALANDPRSRVAAAAGGCMLAHTRALRAAGGFAAIRGALIDDCALAALLKRRGHRIWIGLSHSVTSVRRYARLADFWSMVSRSAFTQLRYSAALLLAVTLAMATLFVAPLAALAAGAAPAAVGAAALGALCAAYLPIVRFYRLPAIWTLTLPLAAALFAAMTWTSALGYWSGTRATWKNRTYGTAS